MNLRKILIRTRRELFELAGSARYSRPALHDMDQKLGKYLDYHGGFFIEAGANNGFAQSNTYYLERFKDWRGVLIEPIPRLYRECKRLRKNSLVFNCALVSTDFEGETIEMIYADLMSIVKGARGSDQEDLSHIRRGVEIQQNVENSYQISIPARTLTSLLDEVIPPAIDLLSLDVEGYEYDVLRGLDLTRYRPRYILVEVKDYTKVDSFLAGQGYRMIDQFSHHDYLFQTDWNDS